MGMMACFPASFDMIVIVIIDHCVQFTRYHIDLSLCYYVKDVYI